MGAADLILGRHVFAHIDDLQDLLAGLETVSHATTLIAFEVPHWSIFRTNEFDTVYHEHLSTFPWWRSKRCWFRRPSSSSG